MFIGEALAPPESKGLDFMSDLARTDEIFYTRAGLDRGRVERIVSDALKGADDGELFLEYRQSEALSFDDGRLKSASFRSEEHTSELQSH